MWTVEYKSSWRKMEAAAQNRDEDGKEWSVAYVTVAATKSRKSL